MGKMIKYHRNGSRINQEEGQVTSYTKTAKPPHTFVCMTLANVKNG